MTDVAVTSPAVVTGVRRPPAAAVPWCGTLSVGLMLAAMGVCLTTRGSAIGAFAAALLAASSVIPALAGGRSGITPMRLHRAIGGITMAALAVVMSTMGAAASGGHAHTPSPLLIVLALVAAQAILSVRIVASTIRSVCADPAAWTPRAAAHLGEVAVMTAGTGLMLLM